MRKGNLHRRMKKFHDVYGPIVRLAPNELSYIDSRAWKDIYGNRPGHLPFERNRTWLKKMQPDEPPSIMGYDEEVHSRLRKAFVHAFSEKSLKEQAPVIESYVNTLVQQLKHRCQPNNNAVIDLVQWLDFTTFDISGDLSFGESFDCLKNGKAHPWVKIAHDFGKGLALISSINMYPPLDRLLWYILPKHIMQRQRDHRAMSAARAQKRLALDTNRPDFVTATKRYSDDKGSLSMPDWELNMTILIFAGSETTASALSGILRMLLQNTDALTKLAGEIRANFRDESEISIGTTGGFQYMNAVINEGLRLCPPSSIGVPRIVPKGGDTVCERVVPEGTYVAFNQFPANRSPQHFDSPDSFIPERCLHSEKEGAKDDTAAFQPFGLGRHSCIGMKLAYAEMRLILARLLYAFDISLADAEDVWDWGSQKTFIFWEKEPLRVVLRAAEQRL